MGYKKCHKRNKQASTCANNPKTTFQKCNKNAPKTSQNRIFRLYLTFCAFRLSNLVSNIL